MSSRRTARRAPRNTSMGAVLGILLLQSMRAAAAKSSSEAFADQLLDIMSDAGDAALQQAGLSLSFNRTDPRAVQAARERGAELLTGVTEATRDGVREAIANGLESGASTRDTAETLRSLLGLTERDVTAVQNLRDQLEEDGASLDDIEREAFDYADELLGNRAEMVSRTETMAAANEGVAESWRQAVDSGELPAGVLKVWIASDDACPECDALNGETVDVSEDFEDGDPPLHPYCACTMGLEEPDDVVVDDVADDEEA